MFAKIATVAALTGIAALVALLSILVFTPPQSYPHTEVEYATKICERGQAMFLIARDWDADEAYADAAVECQKSREFYGSDQAFVDRWVEG